VGRRFAITVLALGAAVLSTAAAVAAGGPGGPDVRSQKDPASPSAPLDLASFLPRSDEVPGWSPKGEALVYRGEDLFTYIDGGADIYNEYGFRQVIVQDYGNTFQKAVTLEVFEMADAAAAFGMFTFKTSARGSAVELGQEGRLEDYYLNFWKGPLVVTVTGFDDSPESVGGVRALARAVDGKIQVRGEKPALPAAFPPEWAERGGLKYLRGPLGLRNLHPVFSRLAIRFHEGAAGWPADGVLAVILRGQTAAETITALSDSEKAFSSSPPFSGYQSRDGGFAGRDAKGNSIEGRLLDGHLALLVAKERLADEEKIWERLRAAIAGQRR